MDFQQILEINGSSFEISMDGRLEFNNLKIIVLRCGFVDSCFLLKNQNGILSFNVREFLFFF